jgi:hypothetical protein
VTLKPGLIGLDAVATIVANAENGDFVEALDIAHAAGYGWDPTLSFNADITPDQAEIGVGTFGTPPSGLVGFFIVHCTGYEPFSIQLSPGSKFGGSMDANYQVPDFDGTIVEVWNSIPEPMTIALLGLGGLALLRRRK